MDNFSFSELYSCVLKATYPMEIGKRTINAGEVIASFDKITVSNIKEFVNISRTSGGWDNRPHIIWETTEEVDLTFSQGVFNKEQFSLLNNAKLLVKQGEEILLNQSDNLESDENGTITCTHEPIENFYVYDKETGEKVAYEKVNEKQYSIGAPFREVLARYDFAYPKEVVSYQVGRRVFEGFITLEARTRVKEDKTGRTKTGIIKIPKMKIVSDLSLMLGSSANPVASTFKGIAIPVGAKGVHKAMEFYILEDDIDKDTD